MASLKYDMEADCLYVSISSGRVHFARAKCIRHLRCGEDADGNSTVELSQRIAVDVDKANKVLGVELIDASRVISELFCEKVAKKDIANLLCRIADGETLTLQFAFKGQKNRHATLSIPKFYQSPVLSVS